MIRSFCVMWQTFEGVGSTKQNAKTAAAERALRAGFVQFRNVEPITRILQARDRDVINPRDDVVDFSSDEPLMSRPTTVVTIFADCAAASIVTASSPQSPSSSSSEAAAAAANDVSQEAVMTSSGWLTAASRRTTMYPSGRQKPVSFRWLCRR